MGIKKEITNDYLKYVSKNYLWVEEIKLGVRNIKYIKCHVFKINCKNELLMIIILLTGSAK